METTQVNILQTHDAYVRCFETPGHEWTHKHEQTIINTLLDARPHGSGIDADWEINVGADEIVCSNSYHSMNGDGMYCCWTEFEVTIKAGHRDIFGQLDWVLVVADNNCDCAYGLNEYLGDTIAYSIDKL